MRKYISLLVFYLVWPVYGVAEGRATSAPDWLTWSDAAFERARQEDRLVLLDLSAEWCAFCKKMDQTTYSDPKVLELIEKAYVPVRIEDEKHPRLAERYREYGRPATVILDSDGNEILRKRGYLKPQWMLWMLEAVSQENSG